VVAEANPFSLPDAGKGYPLRLRGAGAPTPSRDWEIPSGPSLPFDDIRRTSAGAK